MCPLSTIAQLVQQLPHFLSCPTLPYIISHTFRSEEHGHDLILMIQGQFDIYIFLEKTIIKNPFFCLQPAMIGTF